MNPRQRHNVTRKDAWDAAQAGSRKTGQKAFIWFDNNRDGWRWDYESSPYLGQRVHAPPTDKLVPVRP